MQIPPDYRFLVPQTYALFAPLRSKLSRGENL